MVKPVLLYGAEIWGSFNTETRKLQRNPENKLEKAYETVPAEKLNNKICRFILGVHAKTNIATIKGETGR